MPAPKSLNEKWLRSVADLCVCEFATIRATQTGLLRPFRPPPYSGSSASIRGWVRASRRTDRGVSVAGGRGESGYPLIARKQLRCPFGSYPCRVHRVLRHTPPCLLPAAVPTTPSPPLPPQTPCRQSPSTRYCRRAARSSVPRARLRAADL